MKRETSYGQTASGDYIRMPFNRCNLGSEQGLIDDPVLGQGRDPLAPLQDVINDEGDIVVPVDPRYLGLWLTGLFGDPDTTDNLDGSWDHEFASGSDDLPSYTIEVGMPMVPAFFLHAGVKLNSIALEFTRSGAAAAKRAANCSAQTAADRSNALRSASRLGVAGSDVIVQGSSHRTCAASESISLPRTVAGTNAGILPAVTLCQSIVLKSITGRLPRLRCNAAGVSATGHAVGARTFDASGVGDRSATNRSRTTEAMST